MRRAVTLAATTAIAGAGCLGLLAAAGAALGQSSARRVAGRSVTLKVAKNVHNTNAKFSQFAVKRVDTHESIAVGPTGFAVYTFQGETPHHIICRRSSDPASNCWAFWPPVSVKSATGLRKQAGIRGKLGTFHNQGTLQLTLNGRPLYYFTPDIQSHNKGVATSDETKTFGSIWHIVKAFAPGTSHRTSTSTTPASTPANPYPGH